MYKIKRSEDNKETFDAYFKSLFKLDSTPVHQVFSENIAKLHPKIICLFPRVNHFQLDGAFLFLRR